MEKLDFIKIEFLKLVAWAYPGITVVEFNEQFSGMSVEVIRRYALLEGAERKQFKGDWRNGKNVSKNC